MKVERNDYVSNHVYKKLVTFQDVFEQKCYVKSLFKMKKINVDIVFHCPCVRQRCVREASTFPKVLQ